MHSIPYAMPHIVACSGVWVWALTKPGSAAWPRASITLSTFVLLPDGGWGIDDGDAIVLHEQGLAFDAAVLAIDRDQDTVLDQRCSHCYFPLGSSPVRGGRTDAIRARNLKTALRGRR